MDVNDSHTPLKTHTHNNMVIRRTSMVDLPTLPTLAVFFFHFQNDIFKKMCTACSSGIFNQDWTSKRITEESQIRPLKSFQLVFCWQNTSFRWLYPQLALPHHGKSRNPHQKEQPWWLMGIHESTNLAGLDVQYDPMDGPNGCCWSYSMDFHGTDELPEVKHHEAIRLLLLRLCDRLVENFFADLAFQKGHMPGLIENTYPGDDDPW